MVIYQCIKCAKLFTQKSHFINHVNRKYSCVGEGKILPLQNQKQSLTDQNTNKENKPNAKQFICKYCNKKFARNTSLKRHVNEGYCKIKKQIDCDETVQTLRKQIEELQKSQSNNSISITNTNTNTNSNNINITNNVTILDFESEENNLSHEALMRLFDFGFMCVPKYIELVHFCKEKPQNHNIRLTNLKSNLIQVYRAGKFITRPLNSVINELIGEKEHRLIEAYNELKQKHTNFVVDMFEDYLKKRKAEPEKTLKQIRKNCHIHIFNCSDNNNVGMKLEEDIIENMSIVHEF